MVLYSPYENTRPNFVHNETQSNYYKDGMIAEFSTTSTGALLIVTKSPVGTGFWFNWGDGTAREWIAGNGATIVSTTHNYGGLVGTKKITMEGVLSDVTYFDCHDATFGGNISSLGMFTSLSQLRLYNTLVIGDIGSLSGLTSLTHLYLYNTSINGDIANLAGLTSMSLLFIDNTSVSGDIVVLSGLTSLTQLYINDTSVNGDIANLSGLTSLTQLLLNDTSVNGDVADLSSLTSLTHLYINSAAVDTYTTTALPGWSGISIRVQDLGLDQTEVDNFLIDLDTAGGVNGSVNISGSNSAPSAASAAARTALLGKGWTLTLTP